MAEHVGREGRLTRRELLKVGAVGSAGVGLLAGRSLLTPTLVDRGLLSPDGVVGAASMAVADSLYLEETPTSPLILDPFNDPLPVPRALRPAGRLSGPEPGPDAQDSFDGRHQLWPSAVGYPDPLVYEIDVQVASHSFTSSAVLAIDADGKPATSFDASGRTYPAGTARALPGSTIYGFDGTFPGPMINTEYGRPVVVRFVNRLGEATSLDRQDFGSPDFCFLTHLHNAHTAPESDGNPHYAHRAGPRHEGYVPGSWVDNLYLNYPAGGDDSEKQSFFWFHDHTMDATGANVYKGMVGLYPIYDPENGTDAGDETRGLRLPGIRRDHDDGTFDVDYDIPLAFYDCRLDDGVTVHLDMHDKMGQFPAAGNPRAHPEWWGQLFYKHQVNKGFVGDVFTVNGVAYPRLKVKRRKYRFRFLDCSISRIYEWKLMTSTKGPVAARDLGLKDDDLQGQYRIPDGQQCMQFLQVASDGGLLPFALARDSFELWPAKRREVVIDFTRFRDPASGQESPTTTGDVIYLTNVMEMPTGRMWTSSSRFSSDDRYKVPVLAFEIDDDPPEPDASDVAAGKALRPLPPIPGDWAKLLDNRMVFELQRGGGGGEMEWLINGQVFDPSTPIRSLKNPAGREPYARQQIGSFNLWEIRNGGGGWVHPLHIHMEEHRVLMRNGRDTSTRNGSPGHPDDYSREDLVALDPSESVIIGRRFRTFTGPYVAHCHNLNHEDHAMMFGWEITTDPTGSPPAKG